MLHPALKRLGAILLLAACTGCPGSLEDPGRFSVEGGSGSCRDVLQAVLTPDCATALCHSAANKMQGLDLQSTDVASRLVGVPSTEGPGLLIDPSNPSASVIYTKLTASPPFGVRMPFNEPPLDDGTIACVLQWVTEQVDGGVADASPPGDAAIVDDAMVTDEGATASDDGSSSEDVSAEGDATTRDASVPTRDAGSPRDAQTTHFKDASSTADVAAETGESDDAGTD